MMVTDRQLHGDKGSWWIDRNLEQGGWVSSGKGSEDSCMDGESALGRNTGTVTAAWAVERPG